MSEVFEHHMLVRQEHLNQYGNLFGGVVLRVIDEMAFIACVRTFLRQNFVTRAIEEAEFRAPAKLGDVLKFTAHVERIGNTSVTAHVRMEIVSTQTGEQSVSFDGRVVMVCVGPDGKPTPVPKGGAG